MEETKKEYQPSVFLGQFKPYMKDGKPVVWSAVCGNFKYKMTFPKAYDPKTPVFNLYLEQMPPREEKKEAAAPAAGFGFGG